MSPKSDGRLYSRVLRRSVAVVQYIEPGRVFSLDEVAKELHEINYSEFLLPQKSTAISQRRIIDYL